MAERDFYLFLNNDNSKDQHPGNKPTDFTVELPKAYVLDGSWECGLREITTNVKENLFYLGTNICHESYTEDTFYPVLRVISQTSPDSDINLSFSDPFYVKVKVDLLNRLTVFIRGRGLQP